MTWHLLTGITSSEKRGVAPPGLGLPRHPAQKIIHEEVCFYREEQLVGHSGRCHVKFHYYVKSRGAATRVEFPLFKAGQREEAVAHANVVRWLAANDIVLPVLNRNARNLHLLRQRPTLWFPNNMFHARFDCYVSPSIIRMCNEHYDNFLQKFQVWSQCLSTEFVLSGETNIPKCLKEVSLKQLWKLTFIACSTKGSQNILLVETFYV